MAGPHWRFALAVYGAPGVPDACIFLQDAYGIDVNVLLIALFAARYHKQLSEAELIAADATIRAWREEVVRPLRQIRRQMKADSALALGPESAAIRNKVKATELSAEQFEQAILARFLADLEPTSSSGSLFEAATAVVRFYGGEKIQTESDAVERAVAAIVTAAALPQDRSEQSR